MPARRKPLPPGQIRRGTTSRPVPRDEAGNIVWSSLSRSQGLSRGHLAVVAPVVPFQQRRRTPIRPVSGKRRAENRQRRAMVAELYGGERPLCAVWLLRQPEWCTRWADDAHEPLSRARGGSITDPENSAPLCRACHTLITDEEPDWAYEAKLLIHSWDAPGGAA